jgi:hypothetical protein
MARKGMCRIDYRVDPLGAQIAHELIGIAKSTASDVVSGPVRRARRSDKRQDGLKVV